MIRLTSETVALAASALFLSQLVRNRLIAAEAAVTLNIVVQTNPTPMLTLDEHGLIELANDPAIHLMAPRARQLVGANIAAFLPELYHLLGCKDLAPTKHIMRCLGQRDAAATFHADMRGRGRYRTAAE